jgi:hypothetical protein
MYLLFLPMCMISGVPGNMTFDHMAAVISPRRFPNLSFRIADNLDANTQPRSNRKFQGQVAGIGTFMFLAIEFSHPMRPV